MKRLLHRLRNRQTAWGAIDRLAAAIFMILAVGVTWQITRQSRLSNLDSVPLSELKREAGVFYQIGENAPFTGWVTETYETGAMKSKTRVLEGLLHGKSEGWHPNGQPQVLEHFTAGVANGRRIKWNSSGVKISEGTIVNGQFDGVFRKWHDNGQLAEEIAMLQGQPDGPARAWNPDGSLKAEATLSDGQVERQTFFDTDSPSTTRSPR